MKKLLLTIFTSLLALSITASAQQPKALMDNTWISLNGVVTSIDDDSFMLDYGNGSIQVELDDWDWYPETTTALIGERVSVAGMVDRDFFENTEIEADSVYLESLNSYYWVSPTASYYYYYPYTATTLDKTATLEGLVTNVSDDEFTMATDAGDITVEVEAWGDAGLGDIQVGDRVRANGQMDYDLFEGREFEADTFMTLR